MENTFNQSPRRGLYTACALGAGLVLCLLLASRVHTEADLLSIMPPSSPDVQAFREIQQRFDGMDVVQVGIGANDVLTPDFLRALRETSDVLEAMGGVKHVLSLTTVMDFMPDAAHAGIVTDRLVAQVPDNPEAEQALRTKVMQKSHVVGNLIAQDGQAVQLYCFLQHHGEMAATAQRIVRTVQERFSDHALAFAGAPYVAAAMTQTLERDLARLLPWSFAAVALILLWRLRQPWLGATILMATGIGLALWLAGVGALGVTLTPALAMIPLVLCVVGSAYQLQVAMTWRPGMGFFALRHACRSTWGAALLMTVLLLSLAMLPEVGTFCWLTAAGLVAQTVAAFFALPAMLACLPLERISLPDLDGAKPAPRFAGVFFLALVVLFATRIPHIQTRLDGRALLGADSGPMRGMALFREHFGTAQFLFLQADGDFNDPLMLRELEWLADSIALLPGVTAVTHVGGALSEANAALEGLQRIPDTRGKAQLLYGFVGSKPGVAQLISRDAEHALLTIRTAVTGTALDDLITTITQRVADASGPRLVAPSPGDKAALHRLRTRVATRIIAAAHGMGVRLPEDAQAVLMKGLAALPGHPDNPAFVARGVERFMASDECPITLPDDVRTPAVLQAAGKAVAALGQGASDTAVANTLDGVMGEYMTGEDIDDLALSIQGPLDMLWQQTVAQMRARVLLTHTHLPQAPASWHDAVVSAMMDLRSATVLVPSPDDLSHPTPPQATFSVHLTGEPLLHRALAVDVHKNLKCCFFLGAVVLLTGLWLWYRNAAVVLLLAACLTCVGLMTAGAMGARELPLDPTTLPLFVTLTGLGLAYSTFVLAGQGTTAVAAKTHGTLTHALLIYGAFAAFGFARTPALRTMGHLVGVGTVACLLAAWALLPALVAPLLRSVVVRSRGMTAQ